MEEEGQTADDGDSNVNDTNDNSSTDDATDNGGANDGSADDGSTGDDCQGDACQDGENTDRILVVEGSEARGSVQKTVDSQTYDMVHLYLGQGAPIDNGRIYISVEAVIPGMTELEGFMWFRPHDRKNSPYIVLAKAGNSWLEGCSEHYYYQGPLSSTMSDLLLKIGELESLKGITITVKTWYLPAGAESLTPTEIQSAILVFE